MNKKKHSSKRCLTSKVMALLLTISMPLSQVAWALDVAVDQLPVGGSVVAGEAAISQSGVNMNIDQSTQRVAIDWQSFNVGSNAGVNFNQPSSSSVALNRVLDGDPTHACPVIT